MTENSKLHRFFTVQYKGTIYFRFDTYGPEYTVWMMVDKADQVDNVDVYNFLEMVYENVDLDIIKECRQTGKTRTTTKNLLEKAYYEQMTNEERIVKWKCPVCGNYHKWVWSTYDIIGGEITMVCDNPECGATSKMYMVVEKGGNATAFVSAFNNNVEEKLRRATEKVMNSQTEIDISRVLMDGDIVTIMGEKYQRIIEPQSFYDKIYGLLKPNLDERVDTDDITIRVLDLIRENIPEPYKGVGLPEYSVGYNECIRKIEENLK